MFRSVTLQAEHVFDGVVRLPLPMPMGMQVNVYALPGTEGILLVDAGFKSYEGAAALERHLAAIQGGGGGGLDAITTVLLTHGHPDHVGLAHEISERSSATFLMHPAETPVAEGRGGRRALEWFRRNGLPETIVSAPEMKEWNQPVVPPTTPLHDGQVLAWDGLRLEVILAPGHSPGLVCLLDRNRRVLFSSDQVLRRAVSPVNLASPKQGDPLGDHLTSLEHIAGLDVDLVLPGHGRPFHGLEGRAREIIQHHRDRIERVLEHVPKEGATALDIGHRALTDGFHRDEGPGGAGWAKVQRLSQTLAILAHLERTGRARSHVEDDRVTWLRR
jgi:glyoxylase-like metal-dependent hydrolase (beta-lactamase superfamily II)